MYNCVIKGQFHSYHAYMVWEVKDPLSRLGLSPSHLLHHITPMIQLKCNYNIAVLKLLINYICIMLIHHSYMWQLFKINALCIKWSSNIHSSLALSSIPSRVNQRRTKRTDTCCIPWRSVVTNRIEPGSVPWGDVVHLASSRWQGHRLVASLSR